MGLNILVVDDSATVRAVIRKTLALAQVPVEALHEAGNGREALAVLDHQAIDLVFTDIKMPEMDGIEFIEAMDARGLLPQTPVAIVSTEGSATRIAQLTARGATAYVRKPFTPEQLRTVVGQLMEGVQ